MNLSYAVVEVQLGVSEIEIEIGDTSLIPVPSKLSFITTLYSIRLSYLAYSKATVIQSTCSPLSLIGMPASLTQASYAESQERQETASISTKDQIRVPDL